MKKSWLYLITAALLTFFIIWFLIIPLLFQPKLETVKPEISKVVEAVYATGTVEGNITFELRPKYPARLMTLYAEEGDSVEKGFLLAQLEDTEQQAKIRELEANNKYQKINLARQERLFKNNAASKEALEHSRAEYSSGLATIKAAKAVSDNYKIVSPEQCTVIKRDGEIGQLITTDFILFWLKCGDEMRITAEVDEEDIIKVKPKQKVFLRADSFPNKTFESYVTSITPRGDPIARSFRVRIALPENSNFMIGMTVENNIIIREADSGMLLPISAVKDGAVFVKEEEKLIKRQVKTGVKTAAQVEIIQGINKDSLVLKSFGEGLVYVDKVNKSVSD